MLSRPETDLVRRDGALPGLATVLDPEALLAALAPAVAPADVRAASVRYVRYRPHTSCLVAYQIDLGATAPQAVDLHAKVHRLDEPEKLDKARRRAHVPGRLGPGLVVLEDPAIVVWVFPNDVRLKTMRRLADRDACAGLLRRMLPRSPDLWAGTLETLRYKPERRYVARLDAAGEPRAVLKVHSAQRYRRAAASAATFHSGGPLRVPRLLGRSDAHALAVLEWVPGRPLGAALAHGAAALDAVTAVGAALGALHGQAGADLPTSEPRAEAGGLLALAAEVGFLCPDVARSAQELAGRLAGRLAETGPERCPIHGDFSAEQVVFGDGGVAILDLDRAALGDPAADLGTFIAHLERDALRGSFSAERVLALQAALLEGYRAGRGRPLPPRVALYTAVALLRIAPEPFSAREPDWPQRIAAIVGRAAAVAATA